MNASPSGFLVVDKPLGMTSRGAVDRVACWLPRRTRLGHCGTLDPLATGVLVVAIGLGTRLTDYVQRMAKVYRAGIRLGARSDTDDAEGVLTVVADAPVPAPALIERTLAEFVGVIAQVPPAYSAAKIDGRRAYALARRGAEVELAPRQVRIDAIEILGYAFPDVDVEVHCGKGTYIRALARDLGERLGCGAHLRSLRRMRIGPFDGGAAVALDADRDTAQRGLLNLSWALRDLPQITLTPADAQRLLHGQALPWSATESSGEFAVFTTDERLVGVATIEDGSLRPCKIFDPALLRH